MKEINEIVKAWEEAPPSAQMVMITVVDLQGSAYRRPGARLFVVDGQAYGSISGGCLESDLVLTAWERTEQGPAVELFDTTIEEAWGYGLGCRGLITVLIRRVGKDDAELQSLRGHLASRQTSGRVVRLDGPESGSVVADQDLIALLRNLLPDGSDSGRVSVDGNSYFVEMLSPRISLHIFGAGFDALPLSQFADQLGWQVNLYDYRSGLVTQDRFPVAHQLVCSRFEDLEVHGDPIGAAVVMTHNFDQDRAILEKLITKEFAYLGVLGPRSRTERLLQGLMALSSQLFSPIGLDIGAESPVEIALSICAEIQAVMKDRQGGFLKHRANSIHSKFPVL